MIAAEIVDVRDIEGFSFKWPTGVEEFEDGWIYLLKISGHTRHARQGLGSRPAYGRQRVHTVTGLDGNAEVEGSLRLSSAGKTTWINASDCCCTQGRRPC
jgi:hypothetical protein